MTVRTNGGACAGIVFFFVGLSMLVIGAVWGMRTQQFVSSAEHSDGRVIAMVPHQGSKGGTTYAPTVQFMTKDGRQITWTSSTSSSPPAHREGDMVKVLYAANDPQHAQIDSFFDLWFGPLFVGGLFGVVFTLAGVAATLQTLRAGVQLRRMRENGQRVTAEVLGVVAADGMYTIEARATDTRGIPRIFRSAPLAVDPGPKMLGRTTVEVLVDPEDYGTYEVDLGFLKT